MSAGRTIWFPKDVAWWRRERVVALGEEFGADGPAVLDWLTLEAKAQNDGGRVKTGVRSISRGCFVAADVVRHVLSRAVTLGALDDFEESGEVITCRISGFKGDEDRGRAAVRQAAKRSKDAESEAASHGMSRPVTPSHAEFHREEKRKEVTPPSIPPLRGGRQRDKDALRDWISSLAASFTDSEAASKAIDQAVRYGAKDEAAVRAHLERWFPQLEAVPA